MSTEKSDLIPKSYVDIACRAFINYLPDRTGKEKILILSDAQSPDLNQQELALIAQTAFLRLDHRVDHKKITRDFTLIEVDQILTDYLIIFNVSQLAHRGVLFNRLDGTQNRIISPIGATKEMFALGGPLDEDLGQLSERLIRLELILKDTVGLRITTPYGTSLKIPLRPDRKWAVNLGVINPGNWDNMTGTEVEITPDEFNAEGTLVLFGIDNKNSQQELAIDEPVVLKIKNGLIMSIKGGVLATKLRHQLQTCAIKEISEGRDPLNVYRIAEVGLPGKARNWPLEETPTVMAEKWLPHIAFGSSQLGEDGADGFFYVNSHWDELVPNATITVYKKPSDFENNHNGRQIMVNGVYTFL